MIELCALRVGYEGVEKLHGVSLRCPEGRITALIGPNGSGKSTLLKAVAGLLPCMSGTVLLGGEENTRLPRQKLAQALAYLPQSRNIPDISVRRMVLHGRFPYLGYPRRYRPEDYAIVDSALKQTGMYSHSNALMSRLSGGERQKVYLAMAIAQDTPIVLLDEPTTYLDIGHQLWVLQMMEDLKSAGKTVVVVLHDLNLALRCADSVALLEEGSLVAADTPENLAESGLIDRVFRVSTEACVDRDKNPHYLFSLKNTETNCPKGG